jgi:hypothetical protein
MASSHGGMGQSPRSDEIALYRPGIPRQISSDSLIDPHWGPARSSGRMQPVEGELVPRNSLNMPTELPPDKRTAPGTEQTAERAIPMVAQYRCVCGESVAIDVRSGGDCSRCKRHYGPGALEPSLAETVRLEGTPGEPEVATERHVCQPGEKIEHFSVVDLLGHGGMGSVYRAIDESLERYVALKVIDRRSSSHDGDRQVDRLLEEARAQARINHPNVAHIYYVGTAGESPFLAMEMVVGPTLERQLTKGPLPFGKTVRIALQLADALHTTAQYDIVHGDIKPSNILFADSENIKITDFGLARRITASETGGQELAGTLEYLAPEAIRGEPTDYRSDMYALGVTLFKMTFGRLPYDFSGQSPWQAAQAHLHADVTFPERWPQDIPEEWRGILARLLAKNPGNRYTDYETLIADLQRLNPVESPTGGSLPRALAWLVDLTIPAAIQAILFSFLARQSIAGYLLSHPAFRTLMMFTPLIIPLTTIYLFAIWKTSPGKKLFQLRIVGRHGLAPARAVLAIRALFQVIPLWVVAVDAVLVDGLRLTWLDPVPDDIGSLFEIVALAVMIVDSGFALADRQGRSLHDLLLGTRVVLDVAPWRPVDEDDFHRAAPIPDIR